MAQELGLEVSPDNSSEETTVEVTEAVEEVKAKESSGFGIGAAASVGLLSGETFTNVPTGGTIVITTPLGFKLGPFDYTVSIGFGGYSGNNDACRFIVPYFGISYKMLGNFLKATTTIKTGLIFFI